MATTKYNPNDGLRPMTDDTCAVCRRWVPGLAPDDVHSPAAFCICHARGRTDADEDAEMLTAIGRDSWDDAETAPSIPERVTAVQARLQTLLDTVKIMSIQLGAWERAITHRNAMFSTDDEQEEYGPSVTARIAQEDAEAAVTATIEKLEKGTY